jgi:hypothetical protein
MIDKTLQRKVKTERLQYNGLRQTKSQRMIYKTLHRKQKTGKHKHHCISGWTGVLWKGIEFLCSVRCIRHISLVKRHDIENEDMIVTTIDGKYPWLSVTQIFPIGQPSHDADRN